MNYSGNLYGKIGKKYFPMEKTSDDIDNELKAANDSVAVLKRENEELKKIIKSTEMISLTTLFEIESIHGNDAMISAIKHKLDEYKKIINYPHPVCANNGDDTVYIHADGHTTWNSNE